MEPITREEYYLAKIAGTYEGNTPEPVTIEEYYLATMAGDYSGNTPQPVTRLQYYMAKVAGVWGGSQPRRSLFQHQTDCLESRYHPTEITPMQTGGSGCAMRWILKRECMCRGSVKEQLHRKTFSIKVV